MKRLILLVLLIIWCRPAHAIVVWPENGNSYDFIPASYIEEFYGANTWQNAKWFSESFSYKGVRGHLATITSVSENHFLSLTFGTGKPSQFAWIGGHEANDDGTWRWAVGPESGIQFSNGVTPTAPFNYANWGGVEPNDHKSQEDFAMFNIGLTFASIAPGEWADASPIPSSFDPVVGYITEYETGAIPEPSTIFLFATGLLGLALRRKG